MAGILEEGDGRAAPAAASGKLPRPEMSVRGEKKRGGGGGWQVFWRREMGEQPPQEHLESCLDLGSI